MISLRQMKNDGSSNIKGYAQKIESLMFQAATANYPEYWEDDIITLTLIKGLAGMFNGQDLLVPGNIIRSRWTSYMMRGDFDNRMADIGLLFSIRYHDGNTVQGIAAIKAAVKDRDRNTFSSIKKDHIKKLNTAFHHSQVLLYDYDHITGMAFPAVPEAVVGSYPMNWNNWVPYTHGASVSTEIVSSLGIKTTGLYKTAVPFSYQLCFRNLYGLDLDQHPLPLEIARGMKPDKGAFKYLLCVSVGHGNSEPPEDPEISREVYTPLE
ncbi:MAG TPA: hypothetical protein PK573_05405 [Spirochaetota bacterium]|nr:hypothetical protein [Spirochaetota bacterium]